MAKLARVRSALAKIESTYGTDPTPTGADDQLIANTRVVVSFEVEYSGSGTAGTAPKYDPVLRACGMNPTTVANTSVTYVPRSTGFESCTIHYDTDGIRHIVTGCRGTYTISLNANQIPVFNFTLTGQYNAPTDTASPSLTFDDQNDPEIFNDTNTVGFTLFSATNLALQSAEIDIGNEVVYRELVNSTKEVLITNRAATANFVIEAPTLATKDFFALAVAGTAGNLSIQHGDTAGNIITLTAPTSGLSLGNPTGEDALVTEILDGWKDVKDEEGEEVPFDSDSMAQMLDDPYVLRAVINAYTDFLSGGSAKN